MARTHCEGPLLALSILTILNSRQVPCIAGLSDSYTYVRRVTIGNCLLLTLLISRPGPGYEEDAAPDGVAGRSRRSAYCSAAVMGAGNVSMKNRRYYITLIFSACRRTLHVS